MTINDFCDILEERTGWVYNDLKAFQYIRLNNLQHKEENIGGGNVSMATLLFVMVSVYAKALYFISNSHTFNKRTGQTDETAAFKLLVKELRDADVIKNLPDDQSLEMIWNGFRHRLVHRFTVENGKSATTFTFPSSSEFNVNQQLIALKSEQIFKHNGASRNWSVNCDALHATLPDICNFVCDKLKQNPSIDVQKLEAYIG